MKSYEQSGVAALELDTIKPIELDQFNEKVIQNLNPKIADAIKAIEAERSGVEPIAWQDFSSHSKN